MGGYGRHSCGSGEGQVAGTVNTVMNLGDA